MSKRCARCDYTEPEHVNRMSYPKALASVAESLDGPCHRFEVKAPLWMRIFNRRA